MYRVYNDLTNEILFESEDELDCLNYISDNYNVENEEFWNIWIEKVENIK